MRIVKKIFPIIISFCVGFIAGGVFMYGEPVDENNDVMIEEPLDYNSTVGLRVIEFVNKEGMVLSENEEMSAILGCKTMTAEKTEAYAGMSGTTQFRSFTEDIPEMPANHIYDIIWSVGDTDDNLLMTS